MQINNKIMSKIKNYNRKIKHIFKIVKWVFDELFCHFLNLLFKDGKLVAEMTASGKLLHSRTHDCMLYAYVSNVTQPNADRELRTLDLSLSDRVEDASSRKLRHPILPPILSKIFDLSEYMLFKNYKNKTSFIP